MKNKTDESLVLEYKNGNQQAFNELYLRYAKTVKFYTRNLFLLGYDVEDLMQEGFMGLINAVNTFESAKSAFNTYANACIRNSMLTAVKKNMAKNNEIFTKEILL